MKVGMWILSLTVLVAGGLLWSGAPVQADDVPGKILFKDTKSFAPVPFNHVTHKSAGAGCGDCHDALFKKKNGQYRRGQRFDHESAAQG